ncbi:Acetyltransferase, GNAT family [Salipiger mucosus DSM 16094]|uniref:Acetyltransferase, GNAT family n=1 Tax=Salipiger mucosus DSM 16094 TaxID=1123237 RepID=S9QFW5_9RHOB|nr:Acetyltransferase, GNAT family [Salipiger mucosus DSM 16094]
MAELCRVARDEQGILGGAIRYWPVRIGRAQALLLGPVAVHPTAQGEGLGAALIRDTVERARALEWSRILLVGDEPYYRRFGFARLEGVEMPPPTNPERVLGLELVPGAWSGVTGPVTRGA